MEEIESQSAAGTVSERSDGGSKGLLFWFVWLFMALVVYVASIGPVAKLNQAGLIPDGVKVIYAPLGWVADRVPLMDRFIEWYFHIWGVT